ncbi:hypothetical protein DMB38_11775 [Streptomyces sp. WAC 06738]|uniref:hypothetical protein n=1 Tax=Streptomyces sp. WAC 06738 TaxID=2203210 RepID=UPI000F704F45|nr:hypothetical protein DMB38_11775 [Streptomyces sp. WAC 06738]
MADRLAVDGDELERFMRLLKRSVRSLEGVHKALRDSTISGLGTDDLDDACQDFQDDWKYGTGQIGEQVEELAEIVGDSKESYAEVDKALEENLAKSAQGGGT